MIHQATLMRPLDDGRIVTRCGRELPAEMTTDDDEAVECRACRGEVEYVHPRKGGQSKGRGVLTCRICGRPYRDHPLAESCPFPAVVGARS